MIFKDMGQPCCINVPAFRGAGNASVLVVHVSIESEQDMFPRGGCELFL